MTEAIWSEAVLEKLTTLTRASKFNFDAVAAEMGAYCSSVGSDIPIGSITAQECRRQFSASYLGVSEPAACDARKPNNKAVEEFLGTDFTFDEAMAFVDQLQHDSLNRQEEVFKRVLNALDAGGSDRKSADDISSHQEVGADVLSAWRARKQRDEESRVKKEKERVQREEEAVLEAQRVRLARRYETNSEDAQGINPLEHLDNPESGLVAGLESKMVLQNGDPIFSVPETDQDAYLTQHFKMTDFVNSDEFSAILDSLERDLDAQAEAKSRRRKEGVGGAMGEEEEEEEAGESELGEILKYLDSCDNLPTAARGATADEVIADPTDINEVFMQNALSNMQNISNMQTAISANVAAKRAVVGSAEQAVSDSADKKTVSALQLPVPAGVASVAVAPPQPPAPSAAPSSTQPRRVIETILDDSDSDEDDVAAQQRKWRESRNKLKSGAEAAKVEAGGVSAVASAPAQVWGGGGASTKNTAAGLQQRQVVSKYNTHTNNSYFQFGAKIRSEEQEAQYMAMCREEEMLRAEREAASGSGADIGEEEGTESDDSDDGIVTSTPMGKAAAPAQTVARSPVRYVDEEPEPEEVVVVEDDEEEEYQSGDEEPVASGIFSFAGNSATPTQH